MKIVSDGTEYSDKGLSILRVTRYTEPAKGE